MSSTATVRSEADILAKAPLTLRFGKTDYEVPVLTIKKAEAWRKRLVEAVKTVVDVHKTECTTNDVFTQGLAYFFLEMPGTLLDLVCAYAPSLPREVIEEEATDEQLATAIGQVVSIAFPFAAQVATISSVMGMATANRSR